MHFLTGGQPFEEHLKIIVMFKPNFFLFLVNVMGVSQDMRLLNECNWPFRHCEKTRVVVGTPLVQFTNRSEGLSSTVFFAPFLTDLEEQHARPVSSD